MPTTSAAKMASSALPFFTFSFSFGTCVRTQGRLPSGLRLRLPKPYPRDLLFQLAFFVHNFVLLAVGQGDGALAVLEVLLEATFVLLAVGVSEGALAILEALLVLTLVLDLAVGIGVGAPTVLEVVLPTTLVRVAVGPSEIALAIKEVVLVFALVLHLAAAPGVVAQTVLGAALPATFVPVAVGPGFLAFSILTISCALAFDVIPPSHLLLFLALIRMQPPGAKSAPHRHRATCVEPQLFLDCLGQNAVSATSGYSEGEHLEFGVPGGVLPHFRSHTRQLCLVQDCVVQGPLALQGFVKGNDEFWDLVESHGFGQFF